MGSHPSAELVYGIYVYDDDDDKPLEALGIGQDEFEEYAQAQGLEVTYHYSFDWSGYILRAKKSYSASEDVESIPDILPEVDNEEHAKLLEIGQKLGKFPGWLLVAFYG